MVNFAGVFNESYFNGCPVIMGSDSASGSA